MERLAAKMGGTIKWPYNESECLDADFFKVKVFVLHFAECKFVQTKITFVDL